MKATTYFSKQKSCIAVRLDSENDIERAILEIVKMAKFQPKLIEPPSPEWSPYVEIEIPVLTKK